MCDAFSIPTSFSTARQTAMRSVMHSVYRLAFLLRVKQPHVTLITLTITADVNKDLKQTVNACRCGVIWCGEKVINCQQSASLLRMKPNNNTACSYYFSICISEYVPFLKRKKWENVFNGSLAKCTSFWRLLILFLMNYMSLTTRKADQHTWNSNACVWPPRHECCYDFYENTVLLCLNRGTLHWTSNMHKITYHSQWLRQVKDNSIPFIQC